MAMSYTPTDANGSAFIFCLLIVSIVLMTAGTVSVQWFQYHNGFVGLEQGCGCLEIRPTCHVRVSAFLKEQRFFVHDYQCEALRGMESAAVVALACASAMAVLIGGWTFKWAGQESAKLRIATLAVSMFGLAAGAGVFISHASLTKGPGFKGAGLSSVYFVAGMVCFGVVWIACISSFSSGQAPGYALRSVFFRMLISSLGVASVILFMIAIELPMWTRVEVKEGELTIPHFDTVYNQMHDVVGASPSDTNLLHRAETIITPSYRTANSEMTMGLWDACLCARIDDAHNCKWSNVHIFKSGGGHACAKFAISLVVGWVAVALLAMAFIHLCVFREPKVPSFVYLPLALGCTITQLALFTDSGIWHGTAAKGQFIGRGLYFAVFSAMFQLYVLVTLIVYTCIKIMRPALYTADFDDKQSEENFDDDGNDKN
jgi:hypothetical protein